jgi:uncharacterized protein DUF6174
MLNLVRPVGPVALILALAACSDPITGPKTAEAARNLWQAQNISSYSYVAAITSFAPSPGSVSVEVTRGQVMRVTVIGSGAVISTTGWYTVDQLFDQIAAASTPPTVTFDPTRGYPRTIERCCLADDSGSIYTASMLSPSS